MNLSKFSNNNIYDNCYWFNSFSFNVNYLKKNLKNSFLLKYKNEKENLPLTQRELNYYFENHVMEVSLQYNNLYKQILITFYLPLVPSGLIITLIGIILNF